LDAWSSSAAAAAISSVDEELCAGCGQCASLCTFGALSLHPTRGVMTVNGVLCQGCGACATACPSGAINLKHFTFDEVMAQLEVVTGWAGPGTALQPREEQAVEA
jgi:heterodisulfide reductase subunit A